MAARRLTLFDPFITAVVDPNAYADSDCQNADVNGDGNLNAFDIEPFINVVLNGLQNTAVAISLEYHAENRLISYAATYPDPNSSKVTFDYDYQGRRIEKKFYGWDPNGLAPDPNDPNLMAPIGNWSQTPTEHTKFVYDGWRVVLELDGMNGDFVSRKLISLTDSSDDSHGVVAARRLTLFDQ